MCIRHHQIYSSLAFTCDMKCLRRLMISQWLAYSLSSLFTYQMSPPNHKMTTSSLALTIAYVAKNYAIKRVLDLSNVWSGFCLHLRELHSDDSSGIMFTFFCWHFFSTLIVNVSWGQFHQHSTYSFYARGVQKRERDSEVVNLFTLLGTMRT